MDITGSQNIRKLNDANARIVSLNISQQFSSTSFQNLSSVITIQCCITSAVRKVLLNNLKISHWEDVGKWVPQCCFDEGGGNWQYIQDWFIKRVVELAVVLFIAFHIAGTKMYCHMKKIVWD